MPSTSPAVCLTEKSCKCCGIKLVITKQRDIDRKQYCSFNCKSKFQKTIPTKPRIFSEARKCEGCGIDYIANQKVQRFCSKGCQARIGARRSLAKNNTLDGHLKRLLNRKERKHLTIDFLTKTSKNVSLNHLLTLSS